MFVVRELSGDDNPLITMENSAATTDELRKFVIEYRKSYQVRGPKTV